MFDPPESHDFESAAAPAKGMSRRQIVKVGVWAAPVVVLAAASPAAAVSVTGVTLQGHEHSQQRWPADVKIQLVDRHRGHA